MSKSRNRFWIAIAILFMVMLGLVARRASTSSTVRRFISASIGRPIESEVKKTEVEPVFSSEDLPSEASKLWAVLHVGDKVSAGDKRLRGIEGALEENGVRAQSIAKTDDELRIDGQQDGQSVVIRMRQSDGGVFHANYEFVKVNKVAPEASVSSPAKTAPSVTRPSEIAAAPPDNGVEARYVGTKAASRLLTDEIFEAEIVFSNVGQVAWKPTTGTEVRLVYVGRGDPEIWGTNFIIQGQANLGEVGKDVTFRSVLRAPSKPGVYEFQWLPRTASGAVGKPSEVLRIEVAASPTNEDWSLEREPTMRPENWGAYGRRALSTKDIQYVGSFRLPKKLKDARSAFSAIGIAILPGGKSMLLNYTHPTQELAEVLIPAPKKLTGVHEINSLNEAKTAKVLGNLVTPIKPTSGVKEIWPNGGIAYDAATETVYWTWSHPYYAGGPVPTFAATSLSNDTPLKPLGHWIVNEAKHHWGGVGWIGKDFADLFLDGKRLGLGFGGYYSICAPCSRGPAFSATDIPNPSLDRLDLQPLINYQSKNPAPRDGQYMIANCSFWNEQPLSRQKGFWAAFDECRAGVFIELKNVAGYITFPHLAFGRIGYDNGAGIIADRTRWWYFYSPEGFAEIALNRSMRFVMPSEMVQDQAIQPGAETLYGIDTGACFDAESRLLYVVRSQAYKEGVEFYPVVNVYRILDQP